ncbi:MAG: hypothetical protein JWL83_2852 [Actinomycetia bacterium]|nr:hypothetical protein [Actinomycetes bacterium]
MTARKLGTIMVAVGATGAVAGLLLDGLQLSNDSTLLTRHGALDPTRPACACFFAGLALVAAGAALLCFEAALYQPEGERVPAGRRFLQVLAPVLAVALVGGAAVAAANSPLGEPATPDSTALTASKSATRVRTALSNALSKPASHDGVVAGSATGQSPCEKAAPTPASPGEVGTGEGGSNAAASAETHGARGLVAQQPLTEAQRRALEVQMEAARTVIAKYATVAAAQAAGYRMSTVYVPCIGAHYTNVGLVGNFDPAAPSELLFDGTHADSKIVGLSYLVYHPGGPPDGFAGPNDHWHQHNANGGLCFKGGTVIGGEELTQTQCEARGGRKSLLTDIWMAHAWVAPGFECSWGVFSGECPELGGKIGVGAWRS